MPALPRRLLSERESEQAEAEHTPRPDCLFSMEKAEELTLPLHLLPDDVLAGVLACLSPRGLAASRCVCKAWRAVVDTRRLLRTELLPFSVGGIFLVPCAIGFPPLFAPPSPTMRHADDDDLGYLEGARNVSSWQIEGHCNGLLLFSDPLVVVNPATRQWSRLPPPPASSLPLGMKDLYHNPYLMFDPITSPHYEVLLVPELPYSEELDPATEELEWPPSPCAMRILSSRTGHWEERSFIRDGPALNTIAGMRDFPYNFCYHNGVYWQGALYVQCNLSNFVMRINSYTGRYHVIAPPASRIPDGCDGFHLGKSEKGVYYVKITYHCELLVWLLDESDGRAQWVLKCNRIVCPMEARRNHAEINGPWFLQFFGNKEDYPEELLTGGDDNDYDNDYLVDEYMAGLDEVALEGETRPFYIRHSGSLTFLGFHPYKEIVFLNFMNTRGVAYDLNTSKMQDLGSLELKRRVYSKEMSIVYTPCWMGELNGSN